MILVFLVLVALTGPVAFALGLASVASLYVGGTTPLQTVTSRMFAGGDSFVLLAIPLFVLAGALMETGGISVRLVNLAKALVGSIRGGLGMVVVVGEMFFSGISGSTLADVSAIGALLVPSMMRAGFTPPQATAIVSAASAMGILIPPCLLMVVVAQMTNLSVGALFFAGFIPAVVLAVAVMAVIYVQAVRSGIGSEKRMGCAAILHAFVDSLISLGMPVIIFGSILGGVADPTEAAVLAVVYALVVGVFVYKEIKITDLPRIFTDSAVMTGVVVFMVGTASSFSWILANEQVPAAITKVMLSLSDSPLVFFILSSIVFIILGAILEGMPAVIICLPVFMPAAVKFGINPLHYSIVVIAAIGVGLFLPPIGVGLYIAAKFAGINVDKAAGAMVPYTVVLFLGMVILMAFPWLTLVIPNMVFGH